jgi:multimeric flavodoxin WrbA
MKKFGKIEFHYLFLQESHLEMCKGCFNCVTRGEKFCPLNDDRENIENLMIDSDGVIFVSPSYCQNVSGLMKNFIDRFAYLFHRPKFFQQKAMALSTSGGAGLKETLDYMDKLSVWGFGPLIKLGLITPHWPRSPRLEQNNKKSIEKKGKKFFESLKTKRPSSPSFTQYMHFRFMKKTSDLEEYLPADNEYYHDKEHYFVPVKINPIYRLLAPLIVKFALYIMKDMGPYQKSG